MIFDDWYNNLRFVFSKLYFALIISIFRNLGVLETELYIS